MLIATRASHVRLLVSLSVSVYERTLYGVYLDLSNLLTYLLTIAELHLTQYCNNYINYT